MYTTTFCVEGNSLPEDELDGCSISQIPISGTTTTSISISGQPSQVLIARTMILSHSLPIHSSSIKVQRELILDLPLSHSPTLNLSIRSFLDDIASITHAHIAVVNSPNSHCELVISANLNALDHARVRLLIMLDRLSGLHSESLDIDHKLIPIIAGRNRSTLRSIQESTCTNMYLPSPLQPLDSIWISGEFFGVQRAKDMLIQIAAQKSSSLLSKDTAILPRKLDFLLQHSDDLKSIMASSASFILLPPITSPTPLITIYADSSINLAKSMSSLMHLLTQFFIASFWLLPTHYNSLLPPPSSALQLSLALNKPLSQDPSPTTLLQQISIASRAEVVFKGMSFELYGLEHQVRKAVSMIMDLDIIKVPFPFLLFFSPFSNLLSVLSPPSQLPTRIIKRTSRLHLW